MGSIYKNVEDAKTKLLPRIRAVVEKSGVFTTGTCATGAAYGWDMNLHYAMEWFRRNPPEGLHVSCTTRHECQDWAVTLR
jgi:hypothetical protein